MHVDLINGFLGAGKTTLLINLLENAVSDEKVAVLVNEFGAVGIDGDLLTGHGADVVELPNGCICCTLKADLRNQIKEIAETYKPDRLYIEPTGAATIKNLMGILGSLSLEKYIDNIRVVLIIDASTFTESYRVNRGFVETQLEMAQVVIINKCDRVDAEELAVVTDLVKKINYSGQVLLTSFGKVSKIDLDSQKAFSNAFEINFRKVNEHMHDQPLKKYEQFSTQSNRVFDIDKLRSLFKNLQNKWYGSVDRAKGIFKIADNEWVRFDLASCEVSEDNLIKKPAVSKLIVIGTDLSKGLLNNEFKSCIRS